MEGHLWLCNAILWQTRQDFGCRRVFIDFDFIFVCCWSFVGLLVWWLLGCAWTPPVDSIQAPHTHNHIRNLIYTFSLVVVSIYWAKKSDLLYSVHLHFGGEVLLLILEYFWSHICKQLYAWRWWSENYTFHTELSSWANLFTLISVSGKNCDAQISSPFIVNLSSASISWKIFSKLIAIFGAIKGTLYLVFYPNLHFLPNWGKCFAKITLQQCPIDFWTNQFVKF